MRKIKYLLQNGLPEYGYESKRRRVLATVCTQQIYLIPTAERKPADGYGVMAARMLE